MLEAVIDAGDGLPLTLPALLARQSGRFGQRILLATDEVTLTFEEADRRSRSVARRLLAAGVTKGSHVGLLLPNGSDFVIHMLAAARIGAIVLPFSTLSTALELRQVLIQSDTQFLIAAPGFRKRDYRSLLSEAFPSIDLDGAGVRSPEAPFLRHVWFIDDDGLSRFDEVDVELLHAAEARVSSGDRLVIIHTSGSTGVPKGVIHTHGALLRHVNNMNLVRRLFPDDALFATAPWFWIAGFAFALLSTFSAGARLVYSHAQSAGTVLDLLERERPTLTNGYPAGVNWLADDPSFKDRDFSWLKRGNLWPIMDHSSRPADPSWRHDLYGTSETGSGLSMCDEEGDVPEHRRGAAGKLLPGLEGKVIDPESGRECEPGEIGELWLRGPFMMEGYYGKPRSEVFDIEGWWRTSDAVSIDADGYVFLKGRLGNMIKSAGVNVAPREVELELAELTGGVFNAVVGVPDVERGQAVVAVVFTDAADLDEDALRGKLAARLSPYKVPRRILACPPAEMPVVQSGKIDLAALKLRVERELKNA